jgi:UDP-galactopyranose mutase
MIKKYDYLIVGAGLYGSLMARKLKNSGNSVLVIDKRNHIGGNCFSYKENGIEIQQYGPHIFHTDSWHVWTLMNSIDEFIPFKIEAYSQFESRTYNFPINLKTINDFFHSSFNPEQAQEFITSHKIPNKKPKNMEEYILSQIGEGLYYAFIKEHTEKMWGRPCAELPADIIKRIPIRYNYNTSYFPDEHIYQGVPKNGWGKWFEKLLDSIPIESNTDYFLEDFRSLAKKIIYTGPIDKYFNFSEGILNWRSLKFRKDIVNCPDYQGCPIILFPEKKYLHTRQVEYKHISQVKTDNTIIVCEYPCDNLSEPYYPTNTDVDKRILKKYLKLASKEKNIFFGGRLAEYKYYDMDMIVKKIHGIT